VVDAVPDRHERDVDVGDVEGAGDLVHLDIRVDHAAAFLVEDAVLEQRVRHPLDHAALDLALDGEGVDGDAAVVDGDDALAAALAVGEIHFPCGELRSGREALPRVLVVFGAVGRGRDTGRRKLGARFGEREPVRRVAGRLDDAALDGYRVRCDVPLAGD